MAKKDTAVMISGMGVGLAILQSLVAKTRKAGLPDEEIHKLSTPEGDGLLDKFVGLMVESVRPESKLKPASFLKLISGGSVLELDPADGTEIIPDATSVFTAGIDSDFRRWGADQPGRPTKKTPVVVHEVVRDATFVQMFGELSDDVRRLCFTQAQILGFVKKHRDWLRVDGYATFFLFESNGELFVADVSVRSGGGPRVRVVRFGLSDVWCAECRHRLVAPQL